MTQQSGPGRNMVKDLCGGSRAMVAREPLVAWLGSIECAMVLDQFIYWQDAADGEWWGKTDRDIRDWLYISQHALVQARMKLESLELLRKDRRGLPAKLCYLVDMDAVRAGLTAFLKAREESKRERATSSANTHRQFCENAEHIKRVQVKATGATAPVLDLASGLRPSVKSRPGTAADAGGTALHAAPGGKPAKPQAKPKYEPQYTATGSLWIPRTPDKRHVEPVFYQGRTENGAQAKATTTSKTKAATTSRATSTDAHPPAPRGAGSAHAAGAGPRSVADPTRDTPAAPNAAHRPRQRAPRPTDPFFNLFGELVLKGQPTSRDRGLAGEFASRCVGNQVTERALRDWRHDLTVTGEAKFLRPYNAWAMFAPWWDKRIGKYIETPGMPSELERFGGAGSGEQWAHIRYGLTAER